MILVINRFMFPVETCPYRRLTELTRGLSAGPGKAKELGWPSDSSGRDAGTCADSFMGVEG
jgi:hypothetical protein